MCSTTAQAPPVSVTASTPSRSTSRSGSRRRRRRLRWRREACTKSGDADQRMQDVVLRVDGNELEDGIPIPVDEPDDRDHDVDRAEGERIGPRARIGPRYREAHDAARDVHEVVPAVDVEDAEHGRALDERVVTDREARLVEEAEDPGRYED